MSIWLRGTVLEGAGYAREKIGCAVEEGFGALGYKCWRGGVMLEN